MGVRESVRTVLPVETDRELDWRATVALGAVLAVGAWLRVRGLARESLWMDEVYSITYVTERSTVELLTELPFEDPHPPLYYLLLDGWVALFGPGKVAVRSLSVLLGIACIGLLYALGARLYNREVGLVGAAFLALSATHLYYAQDARMYPLYVALSLASLYWFVRLVFDGDRSRGTLAGYVAATVLLGYTHVFGLFVVLAQNTYLLSHVLRDGTSLRRGFRATLRTPLVGRWVRLQAVTGLLLGPQLGLLAMRLLELGPFEAVAPAWIPLTSPARFLGTLSRYFDKGWAPDVLSVTFGFGAVTLALWALTSDPEPGGPVERPTAGDEDGGPDDVATRASAALDRWLPSRRATFLLLVLLVPWAVPFVLSHAVTPIYRTKYTLAASIGFFLLVARGIENLRVTTVGPGRFLVVAVVVLSLFIPVGAIHAYPQNPEWEAAISDVEAAEANPHVVVAGGQVPGQYYPVVSLASEGTTTATISPDPTWDGDVAAATGGRESVWLVLSGWRLNESQHRQATERFEDAGYWVSREREYYAVTVRRLERG